MNHTLYGLVSKTAQASMGSGVLRFGELPVCSVLPPSPPSLHPLAGVRFDEYHSVTEDRFICIGPIQAGLVLVVKTEPAEDVVRIVSARRATRHERTLYKEYMEGNQG